MTLKVQIDDQIRNATASEIANIQEIAAETAAQVADAQAKAIAKAALLEKLGITADEAALLLS